MDLGSLTLSRHLRDLRAVRDALLGAESAVLIGSSLGGLVAAMAAAREPATVRALLLIAPAFGFARRLEARLGNAAVAEWRRTGKLEWRSEVVNATLDYAFLEDGKRLDDDTLAASIRAPVLLAHGTRDDSVPVEESDRFRARCTAPVEYLRIEGGTHRLEAHREALIEALLRFLDRLGL